MAAVARRIASLEGQILGIIDELAALKVIANQPNATPQTPTPTIDELFVLLDFETGGLGKTSDIRICQVGAIILDQEMNKLGEFDEFVNPLREISTAATAVNNISNNFVKNLDDWSKVGLRLNQLIAGFANGMPVTLCAHNGKRYVGILSFITLILF